MQVGAERGKAESRGLGKVITRVGLQGHKGMSLGVHGWAPNVLTPTPQTPRHQSLLSVPPLSVLNWGSLTFCSPGRRNVQGYLELRGDELVH